MLDKKSELTHQQQPQHVNVVLST